MGETRASGGAGAASGGAGWQRVVLEPGLHLLATPIGAARDITLRALDILASADVLAAEDTRSLRHLMEIHDVPLAGRPLIAYHDHNGAAMRPRLLAALAGGKSVAYASEAGTPLVADPGFQLVRSAVAEGRTVRAAPGPSAVLAALAVAGLPTDRFLFAGFAPAAAGARRSFLAGLADTGATVVLFESPKRVHRIFGELVEYFGGNRQAALCRELTKRFEEVRRGTLAELALGLAGQEVKGEVVLLIDRAEAAFADGDTLDAALSTALAAMPVSAAAAEVARRLGLPRRQVYQRALALSAEE
jgi:16S rRNA (cytidine1402-2'-O)-methyltransferase